MAKKQKSKVDNLYYFSDNVGTSINEKNSKKRSKERERRVRKNRENTKKINNFDYDTETVINMTNKNNQRAKQQKQTKMSKKQRQLLKRKKKIKKVLKWTSLFIIIVGGVIFALVSPIFNITDIIVSDNSQIPKDTIISLSGLSIGQNIFKFTSDGTKRKIKENAYIENVNINRKIPNKVEIKVEERQKDYNVEFLNGYAYINKQGYILEISDKKLELPTIQGIVTPEDQIVAGNRLNEEDLTKIENVIQIINICKDYGLDTKITSIDITNKNDYSIYIEDEKKTIYLGDESNLSTKMLYVQAIIEENKGIEGNIYVDGNFNNTLKARFREKV